MMLDQDELAWTWLGTTVRVGVDRFGTGPTVLLLPALSSISTRDEMRPLQERLGDSYSTVAVDWPGFGNKPRPPIDWLPDTYRAFLTHLLTEVVPRPFATIAAGHAAGYLLGQAADARDSAGRLCLIAPTWGGPLPTLTGKRLALFGRLARMVDYPVVGPLLYRLNVNRPVIGMMARGHVYADAEWLTPPRLAAKLAVTRVKGARHASIRFVAGTLDPVQHRAEFVAMAARVGAPVLAIYGAGTPAKSKAEIEALAALPNVRLVQLPAGKLSVHEEFPDAVAGAVRTFFADVERAAAIQ
jgi:pimeloyl-ACP methyl ester carboxylesterase